MNQTKQFDLAILAIKKSIEYYRNIEQKTFELGQEVRSWEAELHRINAETIMVKMTNNHQEFAELYKEKRSIEKSLHACEKSMKTLTALKRSYIECPLILN